MNLREYENRKKQEKPKISNDKNRALLIVKVKEHIELLKKELNIAETFLSSLDDIQEDRIKLFESKALNA